MGSRIEISANRFSQLKCIVVAGGFTTSIIRHKACIVVIVFAFLAIRMLYNTFDKGRLTPDLRKHGTGRQTIVNLRGFFICMVKSIYKYLVFAHYCDMYLLHFLA